jgi:hypothetical protein
MWLENKLAAALFNNQRLSTDNFLNIQYYSKRFHLNSPGGRVRRVFERGIVSQGQTQALIS